jgi:hypothetical protein
VTARIGSPSFGPKEARNDTKKDSAIWDLNPQSIPRVFIVLFRAFSWPKIPGMAQRKLALLRRAL